jgi:sterol 3beta-glucosyltransferase
MKILLITIGTHGDVQPFVALALGLKSAGHQVMICTCPRFQNFVESFDVEFAPLEQGLVDLLDSAIGRSLFQNLRSVFGVLRTIPQVIAQVGPIHRRMVDDSWAAVQTFAPDVMVYHPKMFCVPAFAAVLGIPAMLLLFYPMLVPTGAFPLFGPNLSRWGNRLSYRLVLSATRLGTRSYLKHWRKAFDPNHLSRHSGLLYTSADRPVAVAHAHSAALCPRPIDWPAHARVVGPCVLPTRTEYLPPRALVDFLAAGDAPIYIGFGSMADIDPTGLSQRMVAAAKLAGCRLILATGWGGLRAIDAEQVFSVESVDHAWLFPKVAAVVHHGGAGTTAAGLLASCPTLICPFGLDQPFWGRCVQQSGAGLMLRSPSKVGAEELANALRKVLSDPSFRKHAQRLGDQMRQEQGVANTVAWIEQLKNELAR